MRNSLLLLFHISLYWGYFVDLGDWMGLGVMCNDFEICGWIPEIFVNTHAEKYSTDICNCRYKKEGGNLHIIESSIINYHYASL